MIIDFHSHFYPRGYLEELRKGKGYASFTQDAQGRLLLHYTGDYNVIVGSHINIDDRIKAMRKCGVHMQVLSLTTPSVERETRARGIRLAQLANDEFGVIVDKYPDYFTALAALPIQDADAASTELERAVRTCGLKGAVLMSNVDGQQLDAAKFLPIYEKAVKLDVPLFIHPTSPTNQTAMEDYRLIPILGFVVDTTLAVLRLVFSGVLKRLPQLKLVASHLGGVFPHLRGRIEQGFNAYSECKVSIAEPPSTYLKKIWVDSLCYDRAVFLSTYAFSGADKIVMGSDFPHQIADLKHAIERIRLLKISSIEKEKILGENAAKLLKL